MVLTVSFALPGEPGLFATITCGYVLSKPGWPDPTPQTLPHRPPAPPPPQTPPPPVSPALTRLARCLRARADPGLVPPAHPGISRPSARGGGPRPPTRPGLWGPRPPPSPPALSPPPPGGRRSPRAPAPPTL